LKKIVLDTNVFLVSISSKSKLHWIFKNLLEEKFILCLTTDILLEYAEIIELHMGFIASDSALGVLQNLPNVAFVTNYYKFNLLKDEDDNKFVDYAIASNADFIVSHDKDFNSLKQIYFPKVSVINTLDFQKLFNKS
jgi:uncharacterized protein